MTTASPMLQPKGDELRPPAAARLGPRPQFKILGILALLLGIAVLTAVRSPSFLGEGNVENLLYRTALFSILGIGVAFVIITGGIDLSIGSVVALVGCLLPMLIAINYRAIDQARLLELYKDDPKAAVLGDQSGAFKPGQLAYISAETGNAVLTVKSAKYDADYLLEAAGIRQQATVVEFTTPAPFDATVGTMSPTTRIRRVEAPAAGSGDAKAGYKTLTLERPDPVPTANDLLRVVRQDGTSPVEVHVVSVGAEKDGVRLVVVRDQTSALSPDYAFAAAKPHVQKLGISTAVTLLLALSALIGLTHGLLITKLKLQPFVVTLCGLLIYRGVIRWLTNEQSQGFGSNSAYEGLRYLSTGSPFAVPVPFLTWAADRSTAGPLWAWIDLPMSFLIMVGIAVVAAVFLNKTIYGRYLLALGRNEQAARYSGINTDRMTILAYVVCSLMAGFGGILFILNDNQGQPSNYGNFYELYAIAAAVLGGCSLRGGEGSILGVVIGAATMQVLRNAINLQPEIGTTLEYAVIGFVILIGVVADELVKRYAAKRRAVRQMG